MPGPGHVLGGGYPDRPRHYSTFVAPNLILIETIVADFSGGDLATWFSDSYGTPVEAGGVVTVPATSGFAAAQTLPLYTLQNSFVFVQLTPPPAAGAVVESAAEMLVTSTTAGTDAGFNINTVTGVLTAMRRVGYAGTYQEFAYNPVTMAWVRLRETGGNLYWDVSPDGFTWTQIYTEASPAWVADTTLRLALTSHRDSGTNNVATFDNVNIPGAPATNTPAGGSSTGAARKVAVTVGRCVGGATPTAVGPRTKIAFGAGTTAAGATSRGSATVVVPAVQVTGSATGGGSSSGAAARRAPDTGTTTAGGSARAAATRVAAAAAPTAAGASSRATATAVVRVAPQTGRVTGGAASSTATVGKVATPGGRAAGGAVTRSTTVRVTGETGRVAAGALPRVSATGAVRVAPAAGRAAGGASSRATVARAAAPTGRTAAGVTAHTTVARTAAQAGRTVAGVTGRAAETKRVPAVPTTTTAGGSSSGVPYSVQMSSQAGRTAGGGASSGGVRKVAAPTGRTAGGVTARGVAVRVAGRTAVTAGGVTARGTTARAATATGRAAAGVVSRAVVARAATEAGRTAAGALPRAVAVRAAPATGQTTAGGATTGVGTGVLIRLTETIVADFSGGDLAEWFPDSYGAPVEAGGVATVPVNQGFGAIQTDDVYTLQGSYVFAEIVPPAAGGAVSEALAELLVLTSVAGTNAGFSVNAATGLISALNRVGYAGGVSFPYDPVTMRWVRLRETGGVLYWDTSPDGSTWTLLHSEASPEWVGDTDLRVAGTTHRDSGTDDAATFDNINIPGVPATNTPAGPSSTAVAGKAAPTAGLVTSGAVSRASGAATRTTGGVVVGGVTSRGTVGRVAAQTGRAAAGAASSAGVLAKTVTSAGRMAAGALSRAATTKRVPAVATRTAGGLASSGVPFGLQTSMQSGRCAAGATTRAAEAKTAQGVTRATGGAVCSAAGRRAAPAAATTTGGAAGDATAVKTTGQGGWTGTNGDPANPGRFDAVHTAAGWAAGGAVPVGWAARITVVAGVAAAGVASAGAVRPVPPPPVPVLDRALAELLACVTAGLAASPGGAPARVCDVPGDLAWDECDCGVLAITVDRLYPSTVFPAESAPGDLIGPCPPPYDAVDLTVTVLRCAPNPVGNAVAPTCAALEAAADVWFGDMDAVRGALACCLPGMEAAGLLVDWLLRDTVPTGPDGGCVGSSARLTLGFDNCWCPAAVGG